MYHRPRESSHIDNIATGIGETGILNNTLFKCCDIFILMLNKILGLCQGDRHPPHPHMILAQSQTFPFHTVGHT